MGRLKVYLKSFSKEGLECSPGHQGHCQEKHPLASHSLLSFGKKPLCPSVLQCMSVPISVSHLQVSQVTPLWCSVTVHLSPLAMLGAMTASESHWGLVGSLGKQAFWEQRVKYASECYTGRFPFSAAPLP